VLNLDKRKEKIKKQEKQRIGVNEELGLYQKEDDDFYFNEEALFFE
jgi:hypothetical protein